MVVRALEEMLAWVSIAPLAFPVVPEVYISIARSSGLTLTEGRGFWRRTRASRKRISSVSGRSIEIRKRSERERSLIASKSLTLPPERTIPFTSASVRIRSISPCCNSGSRGTTAAPQWSIPKKAVAHAARGLEIRATLSPFLTPSSARAAAKRPTVSPSRL